MGLFGGNYERAGSGIAKNAPKKKGFFRYMEIFGRKFWKLIELNLLYFLFFLPLLGAGLLFLLVRSSVGVFLAGVCLILFAVLIGPATAAFMKILKNFVMEKPTFMVSEFFRTMRSEFKHSLVVGLLDCLLVCCIAAACYVYPQLIEQTGSKFFYVLFAITLSVGLIVLLMNFYMFLMMVSTNLSLKNVLKNSFALSVVALKTNVITLLILVAVIAIYLLVFLFVNIRYSMILLFTLPFMPTSWLGLLVAFQCYPIIQKYIINPYYEQRGEVNPELLDTVSEEETVFEDMGGKEKPIEPKAKKSEKRSGGSRSHKGKIIS